MPPAQETFQLQIQIDPCDPSLAITQAVGFADPYEYTLGGAGIPSFNPFDIAIENNCGYDEANIQVSFEITEPVVSRNLKDEGFLAISRDSDTDLSMSLTQITDLDLLVSKTNTDYEITVTVSLEVFSDY